MKKKRGGVLPRWFSGEESDLQGRRFRLDPYVGKVPWRRKWQPTPVFLPGKCHGLRNLAGYKREGHNLAAKQQQQKTKKTKRKKKKKRKQRHSSCGNK